MSSFQMEFSNVWFTLALAQSHKSSVFKNGLDQHVLFKYMFWWMDVLAEQDTLYYELSRGNTITVPLQS